MHLSPYGARNKKIFSKQPFCLFTPCALLSNKCFKHLFKTFVLDIRLNGTKRPSQDLRHPPFGEVSPSADKDSLLRILYC